jgi:hypothetical protein
MMESIVSPDVIVSSIHVIRGQRILLDRDLALLYGVETKALVRAVARNANRFLCGLHVPAHTRRVRGTARGLGSGGFVGWATLSAPRGNAITLV